MTAENDSVRAEFEVFAREQGVLINRADHNGVGLEDYHFPLARGMYQAWQASRERYVPSPCEWLQDEWDGSWDTSCGNKFEIIDGTPEDNEMKFCTYCGGHLVATPNGGNES